jgi:hypothetical protein
MSDELTDKDIREVFERLGISSEEQRERLAPLPAAVQLPDEDRTEVEIFVAHTTKPLEGAEPSNA